MILSISIVVAALLAVVVGQALLANGQVKLSALQHDLMMEQSVHSQAELAVAQLETPSRIVAAAMKEGDVNAIPTELAYVPLSVPLPTPTVTPAPAVTTPTTSSAGAGAPSGASTGSTSSTSGASTTTATTTP
jgi:type II secretory pathway pseudopilin PulG